MMPSSPIHHRTETHYCGRLSTGSAPACADPPDWPAPASPIRSRNAWNRVPAHSLLHPHLCFDAKRPASPPRSNLPAPRAVAKSP